MGNKSNRSDGRFEIKRVVGHRLDGTSIVKSFYGANKTEAKKSYEKYLSEKEKEKERAICTPFPYWAEIWLNTYKKPELKETTFYSSYERPCNCYIVPFFKNKILQEIKQIDIREFLNTVNFLSQSYIQKIIICLNGIFETAIDNDLIQKNPCRRVTCKSTQRKEDKRVYDKASADLLCSVPQKYALLVNILLKMGLRCSELCGLKWSDIDYTEKKMHIRRALTSENNKVYIGDCKTKTSKRTLPVPDDLIKMIQEAQDNSTEEYIAMLDGNHITPAHFNERQLEYFYNTAKVPREKRLTAHELRHTCGTLLYESTKDIYYVSRFLGHSDIGITTKTYVHSEMNESKIHI